MTPRPAIRDAARPGGNVPAMQPSRRRRSMQALRADAPAERLPISGVVIARNEADRIARCVASLAEVCRDVLVLDSGSEDDTVAVARAAGATVEHQDWLGFGAQKNAAIRRARQPWVLLLDADEWLAEDVAPALRSLFADGRVEDADIWQFQRRTHFLGTVLSHGGWGAEQVGRLFRPDVRYGGRLVHETFDKAGKRVARLRARIEHDTARSEQAYAEKLSSYARLWARQRHAEGRRSFAWSPALHAAAYWLRCCVLRLGLLDGPGAWRFHAIHAGYVAEKYRRLRALRRG